MSDTLLIVADSEHDANMLYATGLFVPDPFIYLHYERRPLLVLSDLEIDRARAGAPHCRVAALSDIQRKLRRDRTGIVREEPVIPDGYRRSHTTDAAER